MGYRNLLATFTFPEHAYACEQALRGAGFDVVQVDYVPSTPPDALNHAPAVEWGRQGYQPEVLDDKWTAASAWDHQGPPGLIDGESYLLTAVVPEEDARRAETLIRQHGGRL
ncbi:conserved protein of unknown function [Candidatus Hydrogenisulfobacillus filiaventi]|uniref:Uncharacterized protein n=1 Tax=Candidatus Hydrogenisulfobacillus filiaventi TaxID=2707344 RepID=A0A6F8ZG60_9FIRM|nr:hypothetical protein [Bacillota bacterium]CAB1128738.1 conserved protein of unknown function [Candidatus Hydrogenisulfobacillus filiaventi]